MNFDKQLKNCGLAITHVKKNGKDYDNIYVILPNGNYEQVKFTFFSKDKMNAFKLLCGVNETTENEQVKK